MGNTTKPVTYEHTHLSAATYIELKCLTVPLLSMLAHIHTVNYPTGTAHHICTHLKTDMKYYPSIQLKRAWTSPGAWLYLCEACEGKVDKFDPNGRYWIEQRLWQQEVDISVLRSHIAQLSKKKERAPDFDIFAPQWPAST